MTSPPVGMALERLQQTFLEGINKEVLYIRAEDLTSYPQREMDKIYSYLGLQSIEHDFDNVEDSYDEFDEAANIAGLHRVRKKVEYKPRKPILPEDLFQNYINSSFWKYDFDHIKKQLLWIG